MPTKGIEYLLVLGYLALFIPLWRVFFARDAEPRPAHVGERPATRPVARQVRRLPVEDMFRVPDGLWIHPGHTWAREADGRRVAVGLDEFARQLVGPVVGVRVPVLGADVTQGMPAATLEADSSYVNVLSPVTGHVTAVNRALLDRPDALNADPYGGGWLFEVETPYFEDDRRQLLSGQSAAHYTSAAWEDLSRLFTPELGTIMHDGGTPVDGFARAIDPRGWNEIARQFLRT
jgi:glycine cleavage system H lipoate-binding protein